MTYRYTAIRMVNIKMGGNVGEGAEELEEFSLLVGINMVRPLGEKIWQLLIRLKISAPMTQQSHSQALIQEK